MTLNINGIHWANSDNMGRKLLAKSGWSNGEGLGKDKQGTNDHIKVSIKNEKRGIGLKADKRPSGANLNQILEFENLLKAKNSKPVDSVVTTAPSELRKSRPRYGRALPQDFFETNDHTQSNQIISSSKPVQPNHIKIEPDVNETEITNESQSNGNFTSPYTVWEYFSVKMSGISGRPTLASLKEFLQTRDVKNNSKRACVDEEAIPDETPRKRLKTNISSDDVAEMTVIPNGDMEVPDTDVEKVQVQDSKKKKKRKHEQEDNESQNIENNNDITVQDVKKGSKKTKNAEKDIKAESDMKSKDRKKKHQQEDKDNQKVVVKDDEDIIVEEVNREKSKHDEIEDDAIKSSKEKLKHQQEGKEDEKAGDKINNVCVEEMKKKKKKERKSKTDQREGDADIVIKEEIKQNRAPEINSEFEVVFGKSTSIESNKSIESTEVDPKQKKKKNKKERKSKTDIVMKEEKEQEIQQSQNQPPGINSEFEVVAGKSTESNKSGKSIINHSLVDESIEVDAKDKKKKKKKERKSKTDQREGDADVVMKEEKEQEIQKCQNHPPEIDSEFGVDTDKSTSIETKKLRKSIINQSFVEEVIELEESIDPWTTSTVGSIKGYY